VVIGLDLGSRLVQGNSGANERLQRLLIYLVTLVNVDGTPGVSLKTGIEEAGGILYLSPVQIIPSCDHTGTPLHFHSSTTWGSACLIKTRSRLSIVPRQSPSSLIRSSISCEGDLRFCIRLFFMSRSDLPGPAYVFNGRCPDAVHSPESSA